MNKRQQKKRDKKVPKVSVIIDFETYVNNENAVKIHFNRQIVSECIIGSNRLGSCRYGFLSKAQDNSTKELIDAIYKVRGVYEINLNAYDILVIKGTAHSWKDILDNVMSKIEKSLNRKAVVAQVRM